MVSMTIYYVPVADVQDCTEDIVIFTDDELNVLTQLVKDRFPTIRRGDLINVGSQ